MTIKELIALLAEMPQDAEVVYMVGPYAGEVFSTEIEPYPTYRVDEKRVYL